MSEFFTVFYRFSSPLYTFFFSMWEIVGEEEYFSEKRIILKGDGNRRGGTISKVFSSLFHFWRHNPVTTLSICLLSWAYYVTFQWVKNILSLGVTLVFLLEVGKIFFNDSNSNQESIRVQLERKYGGHISIILTIFIYKE